MLAFGGGLTLGGVLRIFGRAVVPIYAVCAQGDFAAHSRWYRQPPMRGSENLKPAELAAFLRALPLHEAVLMPCSDDWLQAVVALPSSLMNRFRSSLPRAEIVQTMVNKWRFAELLERSCTPHPRTVLIHSCEQLQEMSEKDFDGAIFKPLSSIEFAAKYGVKGYLVRSQAEALKLAPRLEYPIMLQEYVPGPPTESHFIDGFADRRGRICARFARRRLRMHPSDLGNSSLTASVPLSDIGGAVAILEQLLATVPYRGIFSAEFKRDPRNGLFKILEINARPWWYVEFAARCGVNVCHMAYRDALGLPVEPVHEYEVGRRCVFLAHDIRSYREMCKQGVLGLPSWFHSWVGSDGALFAWDDPGPALACAHDFVKRRLHGLGQPRRIRDTGQVPVTPGNEVPAAA